MSGFTALNVEPEDATEEEVDDTKEIQIEEAFKLYQNALKLHSQGPDFFNAADEAYKELFSSEVFKYPEAVTDYGHEQLDDASTLPTPAADQAPISIIPANAADSATNSLPQLIYLSYKNRAQFILDVARHSLDHALPDRRSSCLYYYQYCLKSLQDSASALERDDTDLDLWKKTARICDVISSQRLVRFCLESVVAGDDDTGEQTVDLSGLDEAFASKELLQVLRMIGDDTAVNKLSMTQAQDGLLRMLQQSNDSYPFLPYRGAKLDYLHQSQRPDSFEPRHISIKLASPTHAAFASTFAETLGKDGGGAFSSTLGAFVNILLPSFMERKSSSVAHGADADNETGQPSQKDAETHLDPPVSASSHELLHSPASYHSAPDKVVPEYEPKADEQHSTGDTLPDQITADYGADQNVPQENVQTEMRLPTRKRSSTAAGNEEPESRTKSKRLRARESLMEIAAQDEEIAQENEYYVREQLAIIEDADSACFSYMNKLLSQLNNTGLSARMLQSTELPDDGSEMSEFESDRALNARDLKQAAKNWTEEMSTAVMSGNGTRDAIEKAGGMSLFQRHLKATLPKENGPAIVDNDDEAIIALARSINHSKCALADAAILWLTELFTSSSNPSGLDAPYLRSAWSSEMREDIVFVLLQVDEILFDQIAQQIRDISINTSTKYDHSQDLDLFLARTAELTQTVLEMHVDEYYSMTSPGSEVDENLRVELRDRLQRWVQCATDVMQLYSSAFPFDGKDPLALRFLLTSTLFTGMVTDDDKGHVLSCLSDARAVLKRAGSPTIALPNHRVLPQVSVAAIDQEISRLSTLDFFNSVFDNDNSDPVAIIMKLEPILESADVVTGTLLEQHMSLDTNYQNQIAELKSFLDSGDASLKLFLWRRLQNGYTAISYIPKVVSCLLRSLEIVIDEISTQRHRLLKYQERQLALLRWLRDADEVMTKVLSRVSDEPKAFECLDEDHLYSSISAVANLLGLLIHFVRYDDSLRVGQASPPVLRTNTAMKLFEKSRDRIRDTFVRGWTLLYYLLKEATVQLPENFANSTDQLGEYLRLVHNMLGHRQYCKQCNKLFIKLAKTELLSMRSEIDYSEDIAQVLYDMYQIKLGIGFGDANHGCTADVLGRDKDTAFNLVPVIMTYARKLNAHQLIKSELKGTVDKIQQTLGQAKASPALSSNRKAISAFLKSTINPQEVYRSLKGIGDLMTKPVHGEYAKVAAQGWYQMLGRMSLAKYKSIKRVNPTPTDDLDTASTFLRLDLEHNIADWETWYRLAQVYDSKIEDSLIWNSLKINDSRGEIAVLERNAINAYTMAIAMAMRSADDSAGTVQKISDMFSEFAFRLYASSRPPLSMEAFNTDKHMRHLSSSRDSSMSKAPFIFPFKPYTVWGFAAYLLQRKFATGQKEWLCYYTLGKCFWKMYQSTENAEAKKPVTIEDVLDAFTDAVELVPTKEKSSDYILEPHYKIVSVVHKLVNRKLLSPARGVEYLQATQFARVVHISQDDLDTDWDDYILKILQKLGHADKSNWHHRITARAAHVNYDDDPSITAALGAKHQFTQQIFTKTMTMQVWKPEYERPGRHYVYTGRYLSFFVLLLDRLNDRAALEQLVRRIRRKTTDFLDHPKIWEETALTYVKLLRRVGKIPDGHERNLFDKISYDEFSKMSEKVEKWAHDPDESSPHRDIVQDAIELKKLNNSLMKGPAIDDLIGDAYACMYEAFVNQLPPEEVAPPSAAVLPQGTFINMNTDVVPTGDDNLDRMRLNNLLLAQTDGSVSGLAPATTTLGLGIATPPTGTPPAEPVRIPTPSKPGRTKTITRREVQRKAEACLIKPAPIKTPTLAKRPFIDLPPRRDSAISNLQDSADNDRLHDDEGLLEGSRMGSRRPSMSLRGSAEPDDADRDADGEDGEGDDNDGEADDESELSDIDNDEDEDGSRSDKFSKSNVSQMVERKRKADDEDEEEEDEESGADDAVGELDDDDNDENDGAETGAELGKDDIDMDDDQETVLEIRDSQEGAKSTPKSESKGRK